MTVWFSRGQSNRRRPSLTVKFAIISGVLAALLAGVLSIWLHRFIHNSNITQAEKTASYSMRLVFDATGFQDDQQGTITAAQYTEVTKLLKAMVDSGTYEGAVAWTADGRVAYAAETGRAGRREPARPQVAESLRGRTVSIVVSGISDVVPDLTERSSVSKHGATLETYVPVQLDHKIVAVAEFYQAWRPVQQQIVRESWQALGLVAFGLAVLWAGLLKLVMQASRRLSKQARDNMRLASYDALTGLPNRQLLESRAAQALEDAVRRHRSVALLLLDLDRFKEVNDTLGHHYGDLLLRQVADRLAGLLRDGDTVARLGGDEFVVLLTECDPVGPTAVAKRILRSLHTPFQLAELTVEVGASIGIAYCPQHGDAFDDLLQHADTAMYAAKASGNGFAVYSPKRDAGSLSRLSFPGELRRALAAEDQILLHYQPIASLATGETVGFEALVRWHHPVHGLLQPGAFVPVAEQTGLIRPLTDRVLRLAIARLREWRELGLHTMVAVNVSTRYLNQQLADRIARLLEEYGVDPAQLELEVTESALMADTAVAVEIMTRLRALGLTLSIDDFGTGYSSLAYLKRLPVRKIKVDRSFMADLLTDDTDRTIVEACVKFGSALGITIVAEGIETPEVWQFLKTAGCDLAQGFLLAKPMPGDAVLPWLAQARRSCHCPPGELRSAAVTPNASG